MAIADKERYLQETIQTLKAQWPDNRTVNIVCHGHSVPAGYFATPYVDTFNSYPHLLHRALKERFPFSVINVIVTAIGGEHAEQGAERFADDVLTHKPSVVTIDYGLNDRGIGLARAEEAWAVMIKQAQARGAKVILLTPTSDVTQRSTAGLPECQHLKNHGAQIRDLAAQYGVGLADSLAAFERYQHVSGDVTDLLSSTNHPNHQGHEIVAHELLRWFPT